MKLDNVFELVSREHYQSWHSNKLNSLSFEVRKDFTQADITKGKLVYYTADLSAYNQKYIEKERAFYFYIQADDAILTESQFVNYASIHPGEIYFLTPDNETTKTQTFVYVEHPVNNIHMWLYNDYDRTGKLQLVAEIWNKPGSLEWDHTKIYSKNLKNIGLINANYGSTNKRIALQYNSYKSSGGDYTPNTETEWGLVSPCQPKYCENIAWDSSELTDQFLSIPGQNRIVVCKNCDEVIWKIGTDARATGSLIEKYGMARDNENGYYYNHDEYYGKDDYFPEADLDKATYERVEKYIRECLDDGRCRTRRIKNNVNIEEKRVLVISDPVARHRRPTYHCIVGIKLNGTTDVVELIRGELLMKDMTPATAYWLDRETGKYAKMSYGCYSYCKDFVCDESRVELDPVSLAAWTEDKSLHPELIKTAIACGADKALGLANLKIFNRIQFGALFSEQLFKAGQYDTAKMVAEYIVEHADKPGMRCNNLGDILPGCNPEGTSLIKVFNMTKPAYDLFFEIYAQGSPNMLNFQTAYNTIKRFIPDGVVTTERKKFIEQYYGLRRLGWDTLWLNGIRDQAHLLDYPDLIKPVYKMVNKLMPLGYDARRKYQEILRAYLTFLHYGIKPEDNLIFIEFGVNGPEDEVLKMIGDREHAANTALETHKAKLDAMARQQLEDKYAYRKAHALAALESDKKAEKDHAFKGFTVIAPSQLYGEDVAGSIEKEGKDMQHCVYRQYTQDIASGKYTVLYLRYKGSEDTSLVTIGIDSTGRINQTYGKYDNEISEEQANAIAAWAKTKEGLVTFNSEHANIRPGGWPRWMGVPDIGTIKEGWLDKLARTEK